MDIFKRTYYRLKIDSRERANKVFSKWRLNRLIRIGSDVNFTIISNNCWGGHVYRYFGLPYNSPTIGLFMYAQDYIKFISNLKFYTVQKLEFIKHEQSDYYERLEKAGGHNRTCPIARCGDIEIIFLHYQSEREAREKWSRRCQRINWDNLVFKFSEMNGCTKNDIITFDAIPYEKKIVFVTKDYDVHSQVIFERFRGEGNIPDDTTWFRDYINLFELVSGEFNKR